MSITFPKGFLASGVSCGIKKDRKDLCVVYSTVPSVVSGVFTRNKVRAFCVDYNRKIVKRGIAQVLVVNSGNANACTGEEGEKNLFRTAEMAGRIFGVTPERVAVCSTGVIGKQLPMGKISTGLIKTAKMLDKDGGENAAIAIMTTDTQKKTVVRTATIGGKTVRIGAMAKGSGMIFPNVATMLAFVSTDADVEKRMLDRTLKFAADNSFNRISVDGDMSTSDSVMIFANGLAGNKRISAGGGDFDKFRNAVTDVMAELSIKIVKDGEGATKFIEINVRNAFSETDADKVCRRVSNSLLVKTAVFGEDLNWGRIAAAVGSSGVNVNQKKITIKINGVAVFKNGMGVLKKTLKQENAIMKKKEIFIDIDIGMGKKSGKFWTCDLSVDYVKINANYRT